jgi:hypothetical protein
MARAVLLLVAAGLAFAPSTRAAAAPDDAAETRRDLASFVGFGGYLDDGYDGPSPTGLARRLLERKEAAVKPVLKEAWEAAGIPGTAAAEREVELGRVIRWLYGFDGPASPEAKTAKGQVGFGGTLGAVYEQDGLVLVRPGGTGQRGRVMGEPGWEKDDAAPPRPKLEGLVKGGKWRKTPKPDTKRLLKSFDDGAVEKWTDTEKRSWALALGEAAGADPSALPNLLKRFEEDPNDPWLGLAVAWAGTPASVEALRSRIPALAARVAEGKEAALPLLQRACRGVARSAPGALAEEFGKLKGEAREAAMLGAGFRAAASVLIEEYEKSADAAAREAAFFSMVRLILKAHFSRELPAGKDMPRVVAAFRAMIEGGSDEARKWAEEGSYGLFYMGWRDGTANLNMSQNGVSVTGEGERCGPYPSMAPILKCLDEDLKAGNLVLADDGTGLFDRPAIPFAAGGPAWTGFDNPSPGWVEAKKDAPVKLKAEPIPGGLRVTLTNAGSQPFALNTVALRYVTADFIPVTVGGGSAGARKFTQLDIGLGPLGGWSRWTVPGSALVTLKPGGSHVFDVPIRPDHGSVDHVAIGIHDDMRVPEGSPVPVLRNLPDSWVR